jgi:hypothetical protein
VHWLEIRSNSLFALCVAPYGSFATLLYRFPRSRSRSLTVLGGMPVCVLTGLAVRSTMVLSASIGALGVLIRRPRAECSAAFQWLEILALHRSNHPSCNIIPKPSLRNA